MFQYDNKSFPKKIIYYFHIIYTINYIYIYLSIFVVAQKN